MGMLKSWWTAGLALAACGVLCAHADQSDPPGRAARLGEATGNVSLQPAGVQEWTAAPLNRPLTTGDRLWSDANSRAELDIGAAVVRLGSSTGFSFLNLDDNTAQMQLTAGTLIVRVRDLRSGENYEIDTPNLALTLQQPGEYRVEVNDAGDLTVVKVSEGTAQAQGGGQQVQIAAQQRFSFSGTSELTADAATLGAPDELDAWSAARERQLADSPSREYVAEDVAGTQDLDDNGQWQQTPQYGYVWTPTVVVTGWVPYRFGHWAWIGPWGWTWVDDAPWGYAPFHYGRWVSWNNAWCWVPGPRHVRPLYAPALVGWVGGPGGGPVYGGNVGWFPLGPREVYVPGYPVSPAYARNVNITNTTIINDTYITNIYTNESGHPHYVNNTSAAVTAVPQALFSSGQRLSGHVQHMPPALLSGAVPGAVAPAIVPSRQSVLGPSTPRAIVRPPQALTNRPVLARTPLPRAPVPFESQVSAIQANGGRPLAQPQLARLQPAAAAVPVRMISAPAAPHPAAGNRSAVQPGPSGTKSGFADREHALQNSVSSGATHPAPAPSGFGAPPNEIRPQGIAPAQAPAVHYDRPAAAPPAPEAQPRAPLSAQPARVYEGGAPGHATHAPVSPAPAARPPYPSAPAPQPQHYSPPVPVVSAPLPVHEVPRAPVVVHPQTPPPQPAPVAPRPQATQPGTHESSFNR